MVGEVTGVKTDVLEMFTQSDFIPVIAPLGVDEKVILTILMLTWWLEGRRSIRRRKINSAD